MDKYFLKKLHFLSWHRGTRENDLILGVFADKTLNNMEQADLAIFAQLLQETDEDIFAWIAGNYPPPIPYEHLIEWIRQSYLP